MKSNVWTIMLMTFFLVTISIVAGDIGITSDVLTPPERPEAPGGGGFFDALLATVTWTFNTIGSFFQLLTFQADLPNTVNSLIMLPMTFGVLYLIVVIVRGGAG